MTLTGIAGETPTVIPKMHSSIDQLEIVPFDFNKRYIGRDWPLYGLTMVGVQRLDNIRTLIEEVISERIPGDFVECGVWRGGASLYAAAVFDSLEGGFPRGRHVHLVDSFAGLPKSSTSRDQSVWQKMEFISVSLETVKTNFKRFNLLNQNLHFHRGYFQQSLPAWRKNDFSPIAILRMDGDMYESTMDILYNLWNHISYGGYIIIDDFNSVPEAKEAVNEFLRHHSLGPELIEIDLDGVYFQKLSKISVDKEWYIQFNESRH